LGAVEWHHKNEKTTQKKEKKTLKIKKVFWPIFWGCEEKYISTF
jgi:hypothetical protein